jgi:hypothetical protein
MPTPFESAQLNLQLFDLRREPVLREARSWFLLDFHPATLAEFVAAATGERNASVRMVLGYWDMAASLVTMGSIDADVPRRARRDVRHLRQGRTIPGRDARGVRRARVLPPFRSGGHGCAGRRRHPRAAP